MGCKFTKESEPQQAYKNGEQKKPQLGQWVLTPYGFGEVMEYRERDGMYGVRLGLPDRQFANAYMLGSQLSSPGTLENVSKCKQWCLTSSAIGYVQAWRNQDRIYEVLLGEKDNSYGKGYLHESTMEVFGSYEYVCKYRENKQMLNQWCITSNGIGQIKAFNEDGLFAVEWEQDEKQGVQYISPESIGQVGCRKEMDEIYSTPETSNLGKVQTPMKMDSELSGDEGSEQENTEKEDSPEKQSKEHKSNQNKRNKKKNQKTESTEAPKVEPEAPKVEPEEPKVEPEEPKVEPEEPKVEPEEPKAEPEEPKAEPEPEVVKTRQNNRNSAAKKKKNKARRKNR